MSRPDVETVDAGRRKVSKRAHVDAPARELFALVADPHRHGEIDGSGTVHDTVEGPHELAEGSTFSVRMKQYGVPYRITSTVTVYRPDRVIEWRHPVGHRWRWEFAASTDTTTQVTETFDYSGVPAPVAKLYELMRIPARNASGITATLRGLLSRYRPVRGA